MGITYNNHKSFGIPEYNAAGTVLYVTQLNGHVDYPEEQLDDFYHGHENFINEDIGGNPSNWSVLEPGATSVQVIEAVGNHERVLELYDNDAANQCSAYYPFSARQPYGTVQFYIRKTTAADEVEFQLRDGASAIIALSFEDGFYYHDGAAWHQIVAIEQPQDVWYHVAIHFECTGGEYENLGQYQYSVEINGTLYGPYQFLSHVDELDAINLETNVAGSGYYAYFDAFDFSWERPNQGQRNVPQSQFVSERNAREGWVRRSYSQQRIAINVATGATSISQTRTSETAEWDRRT